MPTTKPTVEITAEQLNGQHIGHQVTFAAAMDQHGPQPIESGAIPVTITSTLQKVFHQGAITTLTVGTDHPFPVEFHLAREAVVEMRVD